MIKLEIYPTSYCFYKNEKVNSIRDIPQYHDVNNLLEWRKNGVYHRLNGPAVIYPDGEKEWCENGIIIKTEYPKK